MSISDSLQKTINSFRHAKSMQEEALATNKESFGRLKTELSEFFDGKAIGDFSDEHLLQDGNRFFVLEESGQLPLYDVYLVEFRLIDKRLVVYRLEIEYPTLLGYANSSTFRNDPKAKQLDRYPTWKVWSNNMLVLPIDCDFGSDEAGKRLVSISYNIWRDLDVMQIRANNLLLKVLAKKIEEYEVDGAYCAMRLNTVHFRSVQRKNQSLIGKLKSLNLDSKVNADLELANEIRQELKKLPHDDAIALFTFYQKDNWTSTFEFISDGTSS